MADKKISALTAATTPLAGTEVLPIVQSSSTDQVSVANLTAGRAVSALSFTAPTIGAASGASLAIQANGTTYQTVLGAGTNNGFVGLGVTDPAQPLDLAAASNKGYCLRYGANAASRNWGLVHDANAYGDALIATSSAKTAGLLDTWRLYFDPTGNVEVSNGNLNIPTAAKGVNFTGNTPAAGKTSQLLNWYEEGTFTPTVIGLTTAGTANYPYTSGLYTRVGRLVTVHIEMRWNTATGTGTLAISNLPWISSASSNNAPFATEMDNVTITANNVPVALISTSANYVIMYQTPVGGGAMTGVPVPAAGTVRLSGTYIV